MADKSEKNGTSFRQFEFCPLCKTSHKKRKKHIYSRHHQDVLNNVINKFTLKISSVKETLFCPSVKDESYERGVKFWCYFCQQECSKHDIMDTCTVIGAGLLQHIACEMHKENLVQFFWDNLLDKKMKPKFILSQEDLHIFKKASFLAVKKWQKAKDIDRKQIATKINMCESARHNLLLQQSESVTSSCIQTDHSGHHRPADLQPSTSRVYKGTVTARGHGLTSIARKDADEEGGNIFTGATPPWLQNDDASNQKGEIGPSLADLQKHLAQEKKSKLPATRVGAKFDHSATTDEDWLPSFGRVWSKGRRLQSKIHFQKQWNGTPQHKMSHHKTKDTPATVTSENQYNDSIPDSSLSNQSSQSSNEIRPYKRQKRDTDFRQMEQSMAISETVTNCNSYHNDSSWNNGQSESNSQLKLTNGIKPYKRKSDHSTNGNFSYRKNGDLAQTRTDNESSNLIQTPLLLDF